MKWKKIFFNIFIYVFIVCFSIVLHELAHCFVCELLGGECLEINPLGTETERNPHVVLVIKELHCRRMTLVAGSFFNVLIMSILVVIGKKKDIWGMFLASYGMIFSEIFYWTTSPLIGRGDAYMLLQTMPLIEPIYFSILMEILFIYVMFKYLYDIKEM